jgi:heme exporter protein B
MSATSSAPSSAVARRHPPGWLRQAWLVAEKDLRIELSTGEILTTAGFFAVLVAIIASLAFFSGDNARRDVAPGVIWVAVAFASILALSRTWQREREEGALLGLLVTPLSRSAIFAGKAIGVAAFITAVQTIVIGISAILFGLDLAVVGGKVALLSAASTPGIAASGTLFGAMTIRTRARDLVLASVLLPLTSPSILTGVAGTRAAIEGARLAQLSDYFLLDGLFAAVFIAGGLGMFEALIEG